MGYATTRDLCEEKRVFKSVRVKNADTQIPCDQSETVLIGPGSAIIKEAEERAEEIVKRAETDVTKKIEKARTEGFEQGKLESKNKYEGLLKSM
jgi:flagellar biosynthesis/type III secretory pathway protein FliH